METTRRNRWEQFPEHAALQQYGRCLGSLLASPAPLRAALELLERVEAGLRHRRLPTV